MRAYSTILGAVATASALGMAIGAYVYAALYDQYSDYLAACYLGASCFLLAGITLLIMGTAETVHRRRANMTPASAAIVEEIR